MTIGSIDFGAQPLFLAPMDEITDPSFRFVCKHFGADMVYTEFVPSDAIIRNIPAALERLRIYDHERPIGIQLYGHIVASMTEAARIAAEFSPDIIDINFGCPVKKIATRGAGAGMLRDLPKMIEMTRNIVDAAAPIPVTAKTRLGWDVNNMNIEEIAERLQDAGIAALTIHGRTRAQMYTGSADWTLIGAVKRNPRIRIPIIGNGDVDSPLKAKEMFTRYGVDGIMIGRAAIGCPWVFRDIKHYLKEDELLLPPSVRERVHIAHLHFSKALEYKPERSAVLEMRRHFNHYFKGIENFKSTRLKLLTSLNVDEIRTILDYIGENYGGKG
jgi:nifR3 family TIM-barrel protein